MSNRHYRGWIDITFTAGIFLHAMNSESFAKRSAYLRKYAVQRRKYDMFTGDTDLQRINRELRSAVWLIVYFSSSVWFSRKLLSDPSGYSFLMWALQLSIVAFCGVIIYRVFRLRWARRALQEQGVGNAAELPVS